MSAPRHSTDANGKQAIARPGLFATHGSELAYDQLTNSEPALPSRSIRVGLPGAALVVRAGGGAGIKATCACLAACDNGLEWNMCGPEVEHFWAGPAGWAT
jgi:hypothetical protein